MKKLGFLLIILSLVSCNPNSFENQINRIRYKEKQLDYLEHLYNVRTDIDVIEKIRVVDSLIVEQEKVVDSLAKVK